MPKDLWPEGVLTRANKNKIALFGHKGVAGKSKWKRRSVYQKRIKKSVLIKNPKIVTPLCISYKTKRQLTYLDQYNRQSLILE